MKDPDFELRRPEYLGAQILVAGRNFGCGSSREHAAWALEDYGFRAVLAPSYGDIFRSNAIKSGLAPLELPEEALDADQGGARDAERADRRPRGARDHASRTASASRSSSTSTHARRSSTGSTTSRARFAARSGSPPTRRRRPARFDTRALA